MSLLYIIVHERCITWFDALFAGPRAVYRVKKEIRRIKNEEPFLSIVDEPEYLHKNMPPSEGLEVRVCGAYRGYCVRIQHITLQARGYAAEIYDPGTLPMFFWEKRDHNKALFESLIKKV